jgi:hypothetical protein
MFGKSLTISMLQKMRVMKEFCIKNGHHFLYILLTLLFSATLTVSSSCAPKSGCKATEDLGPQYDKDGKLKRKRGKTKLFRD